MRRAVLVGDSQLTDSSPTRPVIKLGPRLRDRGYHVATHAVGGLDAPRAATVIHELPIADWTVFCLGANDAAPWKRVPPDEFDASYTTLLGRARSPGVLVLGPAPVAETGVPGSRTNTDIRRYSLIAAAVAERCGAQFAPLIDVLGNSDLADDGVHINDHGYAIIERLVINTIERPSVSADDT